MNDTRRWLPNRGEQRLEWYLRQLMRYVVGGGGIGWELLADKGRNPLALIVLGMIATSTDAVSLLRSLIAQAKAEQRTAAEMVQSELDREREEDR